jgi:hypothetical protein
VTTTTVACAVGHVVPGVHLGGLDHDDCAGCQPAHALSGQRVCGYCERRTRWALRDLPELYADLDEPMVRGAARDGAGSSERAMPRSSDIIDALHAIRRCLATWCQILEEDYAIAPPADTVPAMAHAVAVQAGRLLASEHADQLVGDLVGYDGEDGRHEGLMRWGRRLLDARSATGVRLQCTCGTWITPEADIGGIIRCTGCEAWGDMAWWRDHLAPVTDGPMTADQVRSWLILRGIDVALSTIRYWVHSGVLARLGRDERGRVLYDREHVLAAYLHQRTKRTRRPA